MFDGELPAAECELLARRIDREENLRSCWARYALIGAAMRSEPVATARRGFAARVSAALAGRSLAARRRQSLWWSGALAASLVAGVAGVSVMMLRDAALRRGGAVAVMPQASMNVAQVSSPADSRVAPAPATQVRALNSAPSYVTPAARGSANTFLRTQLADYIVAHSAFSTPLVRRNLLSELVTGEDGVSIAPGFAGAVSPAQQAVAAGADAISPVSRAGR
jgi:negative regulator of sigma E activity